MNWVVLTIIAALLYSFSNLLSKHIVGKLDEYTVAWSRYVFALPVLFVVLFFSGVPRLHPQFWPLVIFLAAIEVGISISFAKAIKSSSLSKSIPFLAFGPFFVAIGGFLLLHESLTFLQIMATVLLIVGAYILNMEREHIRDILAPFKQITTEKGSLYILVLCVVWGAIMPLSKQAVLYSSPEFYTTMLFAFFVCFFTPVYALKNRNAQPFLKKNIFTLVLIGILNGVFFIFLYMAARIGPIAGVSAVVTINVLFTVVLSGVFLKEGGMVQRLFATSIMLLGAVLLTIK